MAHITRISRVPWTKPKNLLGCKTPPPRGKRESLFTTSEALMAGQFEDASPGRPHVQQIDSCATGMQEEVAAQKEDAANGKEEHGDGTPTVLEAPHLARVDNDSNTQNTCTPLNATTTRRTPQGSCGMEALLLAAEHAVSPNPYRTSKQRHTGTNDDFLKQQGLSHVVGQTIPESMSTWHWYSLNHSDSGNGHTPSTVAGDKELESRDHEHEDLPHNVTNGDEDTEGDEEKEEEDYCSEGEDSDKFDLYDQTVLVIRDGVPQYTVYQRPTPKKVEVAPTTSPDDDNDKDNTNGFLSFEERIVQIQDYKRAHGHLSKFTVEHKSLSGFISNQRSKYLRGLLNPARAKRLRALKVPGFEKEPMLVKEAAPTKKPTKNAKAGSKKAASNKQVGTQRQQKSAPSSRGKSKTSPVASTEPAPKRQRTARPPTRFTEETKEAALVNKKLETATPKKKDKSPPKKKSKSPPKKKFGKRGQPHLFVKWEERIVQLEKYQEENGHTAVPANKKKNADGELGRWLAAQRSLHRKRQLKGERVQELRRLKCDGF